MILSSEVIQKQKKISPQNTSWKFAGHETFPFRYGWLKKAVDGVMENSTIFCAPEAIVALGVGKNMVESIRHWGIATRIIEEVERKEYKVTPLGVLLLKHWDPYMEDPGSLWLIHWLLATNAARATAWYLVFNRYSRPDFTKNQLVEFIIEFCWRNNIRVQSSTINRDVDCFIRTYLPITRGNVVLEESFSCPLTELGLLQQLRDGESFQFIVSSKNTLPAAVLGYALFEYIEKTLQKRQTISLSDCLYGEGSPGQVFKLDENSLIEYLEALQEMTSGAIELDDTIGLKQIYFRDRPEPLSFLHNYYDNGAAHDKI
jgi:hypothetical protein